MAHKSFLMCTIFLTSLSLSFHTIYAEMKYIVHNSLPTHPGGIKFQKDVGVPFTKQIMKENNNYIWTTILKQTNLADRKQLDIVEVFINKLQNPGVAGVAWGNNKINISVEFFSEYSPHDFPLKNIFKKLMLHEMMHTFQWNGEGKTPSGLIEGIADYAVLRANITPVFPQRGKGKQWDEGYAVTARFLEYCDGLAPNFVAKLNNMMRKTYDVLFFKNLTGKPVDVLWKEYKSKYPGVSSVAEWMQG